MRGTSLVGFLSGLALLSIMSSVGCATTSPETKAESRAALEKRAEAYWEAQRINDMATVYRMEIPAESSGKQAPPVAAYSSRGKRGQQSDLVGFKIKDVQVDGNKGMVDVEYAHAIYFFGKPHVTETKVKDRWKRVDGEWYHLPPGRKKASSE